MTCEKVTSDNCVVLSTHRRERPLHVTSAAQGSDTVDTPVVTAVIISVSVSVSVGVGVSVSVSVSVK